MTKITFGDHIKKIVEAHLMDIGDDTKRYINKELRQEVSLIKSAMWARHLKNEFCQIETLLRSRVLSCLHDKEDLKLKDIGWEKCRQCDCYRWDKYKDRNFEDVYYERAFDILQSYNETLLEEERKILEDFYNRNIGDMSDHNKWGLYDTKMRELFSKYPVWGEWEF